MASGDAGGRGPETHRRYRRLLRLFFSSDFVDAHGEEMEATFLRLMQLERERYGRIGVVRVWLGALADGVRNGWLGRRGGFGTASQTGTGRGGGTMMDGLWNDLRHALRGFVRAPMFTATAVGTLALGIGAVTSIFAVVNGVLLEPLPFEEPDELVAVWHTAPGWGFDEVPVAVNQWATYREESRTFSGVALWRAEPLTVTGLGEPERVTAVGVTHELLPLLGLEPALGRAFTEEDDAPGAPATVLLAHGYWTSRYGSDPGAVGSTLTLDGRQREIIGILPPDFALPSVQPSIVFPFQWNRDRIAPGGFNYQAVARLAEGATVEQASADVARMIPLATELYGGTPIPVLEAAGFAPSLRPLEQDFVGDVSTALWVLMGSVGVVLLIAWANVANLVLVRSEGRQREVSLRRALGAARGLIARQFLVESTMLSVAGAMGGLSLAYAGVRLVATLAPEGLPRLTNVNVGSEVIALTIAVSLAAGMLFGVLPVARFSTDLLGGLKEGGRGGSAGRGRHRVRSALVVVQMAMALVLFTASGLMLRSFRAMLAVDPGFSEPEDVVTFRLAIPASEIGSPDAVAQALEAVRANLAALPGVTSVAAASSLPMEGDQSNDAVYFEDAPLGPGESPPVMRLEWITGDYFATLGQPLVAGRALEMPDVRDRNAVVVVSQGLAESRWGSSTAALGRRVTWGRAGSTAWSEVVGVVGDVRDDGIDQPPPETLYWPVGVANPHAPAVPAVPRAMSFVLRTSGATPATLSPQIREAVRAVSPNLAIARLGTLVDFVRRSMARTSFTMIMLLIASAVALALGLVGVYGVVSYVVSQRTREIGIRLAVGAAGRDVRDMVLRYALTHAGLGIGVGLIASWALTGLMSSLLYGVEPTDPITFISVAIMLTAVALLASYLPARRAARTDPMVALRSE